MSHCEPGPSGIDESQDDSESIISSNESQNVSDSESESPRLKRKATDELGSDPKRLLTEADVMKFLGGRFPEHTESQNFLKDGPISDNSDDELVESNKQKIKPKGSEGPHQESSFCAHFLEDGTGFLDNSKKYNPMPFFEMALSAAIIEDILACTNQNAELLKLLYNRSLFYSGWKTLSEIEFKIFLSLLYHMEEIKLPKVKDYWKKSRLYSIPIFQNMMPRNRFLAILGALSFNIVVPPPTDEMLAEDKLYKIRPLVDHFNNLVLSLECKQEIPTFKESMEKFKENSLFDNYGWEKKVGIYILHMLLEVACAVYNDQCKGRKLSLHHFRMKVIDWMLPLTPQNDEACSGYKADKPHYMSYIGMNEKGKKRRKRCKFCIDVRNKRKESYFCCSGCPNQPGFCIDGCFAKYHGYC